MKLKYILITVLLLACLCQVASASQYTSQYPPAQSGTYVTATSNNGDAFYAQWFTTDPTQPLTGGAEGNQWYSSNGATTNQRFHIDLGEGKVITRIYYENSHNSGAATTRGAQNFTFWGTNSNASFYNTVYTADANWTQITTSKPFFYQHPASDTESPGYITVTNENSYRYYAFKIPNNYGDANYLGMRRIELQMISLTATFTIDDTTPAVGEAVTFTNSSTGEIDSLFWDFGDGCYAANASAPSHVYNSSGTYAVNLNISSDGSYSDVTHMVYTGIPPILNFSATPLFDRVPLSATFTGSNIGNTSANITYQYQFGDGYYGAALSLSHIYNISGLFSINLTATNDFGTNYSYTSNYIEAIHLNTSFMAYPSITGGMVQFYDNTSGTVPTGWNWTATDGWSSTSQNPSHTFSNTGRYNVTLISQNSSVSNTSTVSPAVYVMPNIINLSGCTGDTARTTTGYIEDEYWGLQLGVTATSVSAEFDSAVTRTGSETLKLSATDATGNGYVGYGENWELSVLPNTLYQFDIYAKTDSVGADGVKFIVYQYEADHSYISVGGTSNKLSGTNDWTLLTTSFTTHADARYIWIRFFNSVTGQTSDAWWDVNSLSVTSLNADFSADHTNAIIHQPVNFTDLTTGSPSEWYWGFGDGGNSTVQNPSYTYHSTGTYSVNLNVSDGTTNSAETKAVYINVYNPAYSEFTVNETLGAEPLSVGFTFLGANATSWYWTFGDGNTSTLENPEFTYNIPGTYTVTCNASNPASFDIETKTDYITVMAVPIANFTSSYSTPKSYVQFNDTSSGGPTSWYWTFGDGNVATTQNPLHLYNASGNYTVSLNASNIVGYDIETKVDYISIYYPVADFYADDTSVFIEDAVVFHDTTTLTPIAWHWDFGDGCYSASQNPSHEYNASGDYTISLTATNTYGPDTETKVDYINIYVIYPVADFTVDDAYILVGDTVTFTDLTTGTPISWSWDFGDTGTSALQNPTYVYTAQGEYTVSLNATNAYGSDIETKINYIHVSPVTSRSMQLNPLDKGNQANYWSLLGYIGGNETLNSTNDAVDIKGILEISQKPYTDLIGDLFYIFVFGIIFIMIYIRQGSAAIPSVLGLILGGFLLSYMPSQYYLVGIGFVALSIVGVLYSIAKER